jgi:hypothetical protein
MAELQLFIDRKKPKNIPGKRECTDWHPSTHPYICPTSGETKLQVKGPAAGNTELSGIHTA